MTRLAADNANAVRLREEVIRRSEAHASSIGVDLVVEWQDEQQRLTFVVARRTSREGAGAQAIRRLLELSDAAGLDVVIDVRASIPGLLRYYQQFGFRACSQDPEEERVHLAEIEEARTRFLSDPHNLAEDFGVTFMWRDRP